MFVSISVSVSVSAPIYVHVYSYSIFEFTLHEHEHEHGRGRGHGDEHGHRDGHEISNENRHGKGGGFNTEMDMIMDTGKHAAMKVYEIKIVEIGYLTLDCLDIGLVRYRNRLQCRICFDPTSEYVRCL
jgi:hypothetical protein